MSINKKYFRRISLEVKRPPYWVDEGKPCLWINFLINQRSHESRPNYLTKKVANNLKEIGFFKWYPGKHVKGKLIRVAPVDSLMHYAAICLKYVVGKPMSQPAPHTLYKDSHYITIFCDNQYRVGEVRHGWCWVNTKDAQIVFMLQNGRWVERNRYNKDDIHDLPF